MMWMSRRGGCEATTSVRKVTKSAPVCRSAVPKDFARVGIQHRVERQRAVALVFEPVALRATGRQRQTGIDPVQRLNRRLLVETEDGRVLRRRQVQPDDAIWR